MAGIGDALRSTRERRGLSIDQVAQDTRISPRFLEALEAEQFHELPAPVYVRGFLRSYANYLKIDPQPLLNKLVGGDNTAAGATEGYVGANGHGSSGKRRSDPFQRNGVVAAAPLARPKPALHSEAEDDGGWAPEPLRPFSPPAPDHGYIPGSDLMEAPEHPLHAEYNEPEPIYQRRTAGVLAERPPAPREPGVPRSVLFVGAGVLGVLAFLLLAVFATRDNGGDDNSPAAASGNRTPAVTPGTVKALTNATASPTGRASTTPQASPSVTETATTTTTPGTATPEPTAAGGAVATPTAAAQPTQAPTATPTSPPTPIPTPTPVPTVVAANSGFGECQPTGTGSYDCGPGPYRVICFAPINPVLNKNWWVDVNWDFGPIPTGSGWRETSVEIGSNGAIIDAGSHGCT